MQKKQLNKYKKQCITFSILHLNKSIQERKKYSNVKIPLVFITN